MPHMIKCLWGIEEEYRVIFLFSSECQKYIMSINDYRVTFILTQ